MERQDGFIPDFDLDEKDGNEAQPEQKGYFHCWVCEERKSEQSGQFWEETVALVEDAFTGKMHHIDYDLLRFVTEW